MNRQGNCKKGMKKWTKGGAAVIDQLLEQPPIKFSPAVNTNGIPADEQLPYDAQGQAYQADLNNRQRYMSDPRNELAASAIGKDMPTTAAYNANTQYKQFLEPNGYKAPPNAKPRLSAILSGLNVGLRGISEKYNRNREDQYTRANIANPYSGILPYNDGRSDNVTYGYDNFKLGGSLPTMPDGGKSPKPEVKVNADTMYIPKGGMNAYYRDKKPTRIEAGVGPEYLPGKDEGIKYSKDWLTSMASINRMSNLIGGDKQQAITNVKNSLKNIDNTIVFSNPTRIDDMAKPPSEVMDSYYKEDSVKRDRGYIQASAAQEMVNENDLQYRRAVLSGGVASNGFYNPSGHYVNITPSFAQSYRKTEKEKAETVVHELSHASGLGDFMKQFEPETPLTKLKKAYATPNLPAETKATLQKGIDKWESKQGDAEYLKTDGFYPRIMEMRHNSNLKPTDKITPEMFKKIKSENNDNDLFRYYNDNDIQWMLNNFVKNNNRKSLNTAKYGGKMPDGGLLPAPVAGFRDLSGSAAYVGTGGGEGFGAAMPYSWQENGFGKNSQTWEGYPTKDPNIGWTDWRKKSFGKEELMRFGTNVEFYKHNMPYNNNYHNKNQHILNATSGLEKPSDKMMFAKRGGKFDPVDFLYGDDDTKNKVNKKENGAISENTAPDNEAEIQDEKRAQAMQQFEQFQYQRAVLEQRKRQEEQTPLNVEQMNVDGVLDRLGGTEGGTTGQKTNLNSSARGRYQIIDGTRESIRKKYFGHMSSEEFENSYNTNPAFEKQVAKSHLSELMGNYGTVGAVKAWYTGSPNYPDDKVPGKSAGNKMTAGQYVRKTLGKYEKGGSIVDYLKGKGVDSSKEARTALAASKGIKDYDFSADKNIELLNTLRNSNSTYQGNFKSAFSKARSNGEETFNWNGKKYNTEVATSERQAAPAQQRQSKPAPVQAEETPVNLNTYNVQRPAEKTYNNNYNLFSYAPKVASAPAPEIIKSEPMKIKQEKVTPNNNKGRTPTQEAPVVEAPSVNQTKPRSGSYPTLPGEKVTASAKRMGRGNETVPFTQQISDLYNGVVGGLERKVEQIQPEDKRSIVKPPEVKQISGLGYKQLYIVPDVKNPKDSLVAFTNTFDNDAGGRYMVGNKQKEVTEAGAKSNFDNVEGVAHFLRDGDILPNQKIAPSKWNTVKGYTFTGTTPGKTITSSGLNDPEKYKMLYKQNQDGSHNIKYLKNKEITKENSRGYENDFTVSSHKYSDIDWDGVGESTGYASKSNWVPLKGGKGRTSIPFKNKDGFSRFSGGSGIYKFTDPKTGKSVGVDVSGSVNTLKEVGNNLIKQYGIKEDALDFIYHDMGSYSAKPKSHNGNLNYKQWQDYNTYNKGFSGAPIMIPKNNNQQLSKNK